MPSKQRIQDIRNWFKNCDTRNADTANHIIRALRILWERQTHSERCSESTLITNNRGFNKSDAHFAGKCIRFLEQSSKLDNWVLVKLKFKLAKYARQLADHYESTKRI